MTRAALLLALAVAFQSLRLLIPVPLAVNMFVIGSLVNACLILAVWKTRVSYALGMAWITPWIAYMQGQLPFIFFVLPVSLGNSLFVLWWYRWRAKRTIVTAVGGAMVKMAALYGGFVCLFMFVAVPKAVQMVILFSMSWPQVVTGVLGSFGAMWAVRYMEGIRK